MTKSLPHPTLPSDIRAMLASSSRAKATWDTITPIARNEWVCWIISGKRVETRKIRLDKAEDMLGAGKRRPCCWAGCTHR